MNTIPVTKTEVLDDFPIVNDWLVRIKDYLNKDLDDKKIEFFYTFGFFLPKSKNTQEYYMQMYEDCSRMKYPDRLNFELSKVRISLTVKNGQFILSDRLPKGHIPTVVFDIVAEITKLKMLVESEYHADKEIIDSIPEINRDLVSFETIKEYVKDDMKVEFDLDSILDKISNLGIDALSDEEKDFLDKKSKDM